MATDIGWISNLESPINPASIPMNCLMRSCHWYINSLLCRRTRAGCLRSANTASAIIVFPEPVPATSTPKCLCRTSFTASCWYGRNSP